MRARARVTGSVNRFNLSPEDGRQNFTNLHCLGHFGSHHLGSGRERWWLKCRRRVQIAKHFTFHWSLVDHAVAKVSASEPISKHSSSVLYEVESFLSTLVHEISSTTQNTDDHQVAEPMGLLLWLSRLVVRWNIWAWLITRWNVWLWGWLVV